MTKGLTATLAIAILFLVSTLMEEGGPLDNFAGKAGNANLATADTGSGDVESSYENRFYVYLRIQQYESRTVKQQVVPADVYEGVGKDPVVFPLVHHTGRGKVQPVKELPSPESDDGY